MDEKKYVNQQGVCPKCQGNNLAYEPVRYTDSMCYFLYKCKDCGQEGEEWYRLDFQGHNIINEEGDLVEL